MDEGNGDIIKNDHSNTQALIKVMSSAATFFSVAYAIILTLSISYNVGYFKQINPQIVDLMGIGDYIDDTIHNLWFFLLATLMFFSSSLALIKLKHDTDFYKLLFFGGFALIISIYFLLKGLYYNKLWPTFKKVIINEYILLYACVIVALVLTLSFFIYRAAHRIARKDLSSYILGVIPIITFCIIVLLPYLGGLMHGYIESNNMREEDYRTYEVTITLSNNEVLKNLVILRKLDKGVLIREFKNAENDSRFILLNWGAIKHITYFNITK